MVEANNLCRRSGRAAVGGFPLWWGRGRARCNSLIMSKLRKRRILKICLAVRVLLDHTVGMTNFSARNEFDDHVAAVIREFFPLRHHHKRTVREHALDILKDYFGYRRMRKAIRAGKNVAQEYSFPD